eukprot:Colp12_sorted_trinity150504_noHs@21749
MAIFRYSLRSLATSYNKGISGFQFTRCLAVNPKASPLDKEMHRCYKENDVQTARSILSTAAPESVLHYTEGFCHLLCKNGYSQEALKIFQETTRRKSESLYSTIIIGLSNENRVSEAENLLKEMKIAGHPMRLRTFKPLFDSYARRDDVDNSFRIHQWSKGEGVIHPEVDHSKLLQLASASVDKNIQSHAFHLFDDLRASGAAMLQKETIENVRKFMESPHLEKLYTCTEIEVDSKDRVCHSCHKTLNSGALLEEERVILNEQLVKFLVSHHKALSGKSEASEPVSDWLKKNGPFTAVIDGLNAGYTRVEKRTSFVPERVVQLFKECERRGWKPAVIVRNHVVARLRRGSPLKDLLQARKVFVVPDASLDDYYSLHASAASLLGDRAVLVSNDQLRDHKMLLPEPARSILQKWQMYHQASFFIAEDGKVTIKTPPTIERLTQKNDDCYHFPKDEEGRLWLCAKPR